MDTIAMRAEFPATKWSVSRRSLVCGAGVNDADYQVKTQATGDRVVCPAYQSWVNMIMRAHHPAYKKRNPTYEDVSVCSEWAYFMKYRSWWITNHVDGYQLDKDLLKVGNRVYSSSTCVFVPRWLNSFNGSHAAARGEYPMGVTWDKEKRLYAARCNNPFTGKREHLGRYDTPEEAHAAWVKGKLGFASALKAKMDAIDDRIYPNIVEIITEGR